jgi:[ribosomal protein S5]-alanine N-acetyltransferase
MSDAFDGPPPVLSTARLRLRELVLDDSRAVHSYAFDPDVARFTPWKPFASEMFARGLVEMILQPQFLSWAITVPPENLAVGMVFLQSFSRQHRRAEVAFNLAKPLWGRGLATEAAGAVLRFGFQGLGLNRIEALCMPQNAASGRVLGKLGMVCEGRMRKFHHRYDGFQDMDLFAVLSSDAPGSPPR